MATKLATKVEQAITRFEDEPAYLAATQQLDELRAAHLDVKDGIAATTRELETANAALDELEVRLLLGQATADEVGKARETAQSVAAKLDGLNRADRSHIEAIRRVNALLPKLREEAIARTLAVFKPKYAAKVAELARILEQASAVNEDLTALWNQMDDAFGGAHPHGQWPRPWPQLRHAVPGDPNLTPLARWLREFEDAGI